MSEIKKITLSKKKVSKIITLLSLGAVVIMAVMQTPAEQQEVKAEINYEAQLDNLTREKEKTETLIQSTELKLKAQELIKTAEELEQSVTSSSSTPENPKETDPVIKEPITEVEIETTEAQPITPEVTTISNSSNMDFKLYNGEVKKGSWFVTNALNNPNATKLYRAFEEAYGAEVATKSVIALYFENSSYKADTVGVCTRKHQINGDYRNCNYADLNSAGMDAGLKQINTFYQKSRIAKLGGPDCLASNSRDITDPCTKSQVEWLQNVDNNIKISLDIYKEQGFCPWYGYKKAFPNAC